LCAVAGVLTFKRKYKCIVLDSRTKTGYTPKVSSDSDYISCEAHWNVGYLATTERGTRHYATDRKVAGSIPDEVGRTRPWSPFSL
jgi:hypothetical protein